MMKEEEKSNKKLLTNNKIKLIENSERVNRINIINNYNFYSSPNIVKNKEMEIENEMRRTCKVKPPLISSKFPAAFEITKYMNKNFTNKKSLISEDLDYMKTFTIQEKNEDENNNSNYNNKEKYNLEPIRLKSVRKEIKIKTQKEEEFNKIEENKKKTKLYLKPIEIRRKLKPTPNLKEISFSENSPVIRKLIERNFAKTSNFDFKLYEDLDLDDNIEINQNKISQLEKKFNLKPGEIIRNITIFKNINENNKSVIEEIEEEKIKNSNFKYKMKLEEMITLKLISTSKTCGNIKIVIHVPSLKLYTIREVPLINKEIRNSLKIMIKMWREKLIENKYMLEIHEDFVNQPEGYHSIIMEYCDYGSLDNLLNSMGSIPENLLKQITYRIIKSLEIYYLKTGEIYNSLSPGNILFDQKCNVKLTPGFKHLFSKYNETIIKNKFIYYDIKMRNKLKILWTKQLDISNNILPVNNDNSYSKNNINHMTISNLKIIKILKKLEMFDLGFMLINCIIVELNEIDISQYICQHLNNKCCCFYHCFENYENKSNHKLKLHNLFKIKNISEDFIDFICILTSYEFEINFSMNRITNHKWISKNKEEKVILNLQEVLTISKIFNFKNDFQYNNSNNFPIMTLDKFIENVSIILPLNLKYFNHLKILNSDQLFNSNLPNLNLEELAHNLETDTQTIITKIKVFYDNILNYK